MALLFLGYAHRQNLLRRMRHTLVHCVVQKPSWRVLLRFFHKIFPTDMRRAERKGTKEGSVHTTGYYGYGWFGNSWRNADGKKMTVANKGVAKLPRINPVCRSPAIAKRRLATIRPLVC